MRIYIYLLLMSTIKGKQKYIKKTPGNTPKKGRKKEMKKTLADIAEFTNVFAN